MRSYNLILFVALVTFSYSNAFEFTNLAEVKELRSSAYGNSLIETISLTLDNSGNIDEVKRLLQDLLFKLNTDQEKALGEWNKLSSDLDSKISNLDTEITKLNSTIINEESTLKDNNGLRDLSKENIEQYERQRGSNDAALKENERRRTKDVTQYQTSTREHSDVENALEAVIKELKKLEGSISGLGRPAHVDEIAAETRDRENLKNSFVQVTKDEAEATLFVQMATSADQEALSKLIKLLDQLKEATKESVNEDSRMEETSKLTYERLKSQLSEDNNLLDTNLATQRANLKTYEDKIAELETSIANNISLRTAKIKEFYETKQFRSEKETQYNQDTAERQKEKGVIQKLEDIVESRLNSMSKFLKSETGAF